MKLWGCKKQELENLLRLEGTIDPQTIEMAKEDLKEYEQEQLGADAYVDIGRFYERRSN